MDERRKGAVLAIAEHQFTKGVLAHLWIRGERDSLGRFEANILTAITAVANASGYDVTFAPTQSAECGALSPIQSQEKGTSHG